MRFSVIIPTCNRVKQLKGCIASLKNMDYNDYEIIVVDDGSRDSTVEFLKKNNIKHFSIKHSGPGMARNKGIENAKGDYIVFTDDDCRVNKYWLRNMENTFDSTDAVGGPVINGSKGYIAESLYIMFLSDWFDYGKKRYLKKIPTCNIAYKKQSIGKLRFKQIPYEDSIFNFEFVNSGKKILFSPKIKIKHFQFGKRSKSKDLKKFFFIMRREADGFAKGGYIVHRRIGSILMQFKFLNLFCPRLLLVFYRCLRSGNLLNFIWHFPLILAGEFYKNLCIFKVRLSVNLRF